VRTRVGYAGGTLADPTYHRLGDHAEAIQIDFDPTIVSYADLLELFWASHHPTEGSWSRQYMAALFYENETQRLEAIESRDRLAENLGQSVKTPLLPLDRFYRAEDYHQKYSLRRQPVLMAEFDGYTPRELVDSTVAARLNGYAARDGNAAQLAAEIDSLGLSAAGRKMLESIY